MWGLSCPITSTVLSYWWYFGIIILARGFFAFSYLVGGFETRPYRGSLGCCAQSRLRHRRNGGGFGIIVLARGFFALSYCRAGLKPAPTRVRWGCCAQSRLRYRRIGGGFGIVVQGFWYYRIVGAGLKPAPTGSRKNLRRKELFAFSGCLR